jgi:proline-specific peptidase
MKEMPYVWLGEEEVDESNFDRNVEIYYEVHGPPDAPPIVFIGGWASYHWIWFRQIPVLSQKFRCIVFDNRGAGRSSKPDYPYTMKMFADDVIGLLDSLKIDTAHILGISMGGLIAQQIAITYPERLRSLIIVSSHFGGANYIPMDDETMALLIAIPTETISPKQAVEMRYQATFSPEFLRTGRAVLEQTERWIARYPAPVHCQIHQTQAVNTYDGEEAIKQITAPTLIVHGTADKAVPPGNAKLLANNIPNSKIEYIEGGSHFSIIEKYDEFNKIVSRFVDEVESTKR